MTTPTQPARRYDASARSTDVFGRVLCSTRDQHLVVDGPIQNGCPGEIFLAGVAACGVELMQVLARQHEVPLRSLNVAIEGTIDYSAPVSPDVTLFNTVRLKIELAGVDQEQGGMLVERFKKRCPLYGSVSVACPDVHVDFQVMP